MSTKIFASLPVKDVKRSMAFYKALGWNHNPQFTDETSAACIVITEDIYLMVLSHEKFSQFTNKKIADAKNTAQVLFALSAELKDDLHRIVDAAVKAGGVEPHPLEDYGFMIQRAFEDPDGHGFAINYMDPAHIQK